MVLRAHSRAKKVVAASSISTVEPSSLHLRRSSRSSRFSSLDTRAASPASIRAWRTYLRSVSALIPNLPAIALIAARSVS